MRGDVRTVLIVAALVLTVALHLGLAGTVVADSKWTGPATDVVVALVALKIVLVVLGFRRHRNGQAQGASRTEDTG